MKVDYLPKPGSRDLYTILVDGEIWREVHRLIFGRAQRLPETPADLAELEEACAKIEFASSKRYALWRLSRFAQCSAEIIKALEKHQVTASTSQRVIDYLIESGFLDDEEYMRRFVASEQARGRGPTAIRAKLYRKGIPSELAQEAVAAVDDNAQRDSLRKLLRTSRYQKRDLSDSRERQKVVGSLARRGFSLDAIFAVLSESR